MNIDQFEVSGAEDDDLGTRVGLPLAFRYLEKIRPRSSWSARDLNPTAQHWLAVHNWFRDQLDGLVELGTLWREGRMDGSIYRGTATPRLRQLLGNLHHHHTLESQHAFPMLSVAEPAMVKGFALLDRDHEVIDPLLSSMAQSAAALLQAGQDAEEIARCATVLASGIDHGARLIGRHLWHEEEIVVPVLTLHGDVLRF